MGRRIDIEADNFPELVGEFEHVGALERAQLGCSTCPFQIRSTKEGPIPPPWPSLTWSNGSARAGAPYVHYINHRRAIVEIGSEARSRPIKVSSKCSPNSSIRHLLLR